MVRCLGRALRILVAVGRRIFVISWVGDLPDVDNELVPVGGEHGHRHPHWSLVLVEASAEVFEDRGVVRDTEELLLVVVSATGGDPVPVADLIEPDRLTQVPHGTLFYVLS